MYWPYSDIDISDFENRIHIAENLLVKNGATYVKDYKETKRWMLRDGTYYTHRDMQKMFRYMGKFIRIDKVFFSHIPCIVVEFSENIDGPYEDTDPLPYNLEMKAFEHEIKYSMGVLQARFDP